MGDVDNGIMSGCVYEHFVMVYIVASKISYDSDEVRGL